MGNKRQKHRLGILSASLISLWMAVLLLFPAAGEAAFTFTKVADTATGIPGGSGNFTGFGEPSLVGDDLAFGGSGNSSQGGIYTRIGGTLDVLVDKTTTFPGTSDFVFAGRPSFDGTNVAFFANGCTATGSSCPSAGILSNIGGALGVVAKNGDPIPGGGTLDFNFDTPSTDSGNVAFWTARFVIGGGNQEWILKSVGGTLSVVASFTTQVPGTLDPFEDLERRPAMSGTNVAFQGRSPFGGVSGIFSDTGGTLGPIATNVTTSANTFEDRLSMEGSTVALVTQNPLGQRGVFTGSGGALTTIAIESTGIPGGSGNFTEFSTPSLDSGKVAFIGEGATNQKGIYTNLTGTLEKVIAKGDPLDLKTVDDVRFGVEGLSGDQVAFRVNFTDGSSGIYVATLDGGGGPGPGPNPDIDGDGIANEIDGTFNGGFNDESGTPSSDFTDEHKGGTSFGSFGFSFGDIALTVTDAADPAGFQIEASGSGFAVARVCRFRVFLTDGDVVNATCSSLDLEVVSGPAEIELGDENDPVVVNVPTGAAVKITETDGTFQIENLSDIDITVETGGQVITVGPGQVSGSCDCGAPGAILGTNGSNFLLGTGGDDTICGLDGRDVIFGRGGNDCIDAGPGDDIVYSGQGDDTAFGRDGNDILLGNRGDDTIDGGDGKDFIIGGRGEDLCTEGELNFRCEGP